MILLRNLHHHQACLLCFELFVAQQQTATVTSTYYCCCTHMVQYTTAAVVPVIRKPLDHVLRLVFVEGQPGSPEGGLERAQRHVLGSVFQSISDHARVTDSDQLTPSALPQARKCMVTSRRRHTAENSVCVGLPREVVVVVAVVVVYSWPPSFGNDVCLIWKLDSGAR